MEPLFELAVTLPELGSRELLRSLHRQLRDAIVDGRLAPGLRLPSTRRLAQLCKVSRNTAVAAYDLLLSEGYVVARPGGGSFVAAALPRSRQRSGAAVNAASTGPLERRLSPAWRQSPALQDGSPAPQSFADFSIGLPDISAFPFDVWQRLAGRALRSFARGRAAYAEPEGRPALREAIARHVSFTRAVACAADDVLVTSGAQQAFDLLARVLVTPAKTAVALEDPGYPPLRLAFEAAGARITGVPTDAEGLMVERLPAATRVVCVTPSHQFPLGTAMSLRRRSALLEFARRHAAVIVEDDYDGEFRYGGRPLDALQTLDRSDSVFYVGTFSKSLFPALRLGYIVAPAWARDALLAAKQVADWHCNALAQDTLAAFMAEGHLARHVRKMRRIYGGRRAALLQAIAQHGRGRLEAAPSESGLHIAAALLGPLRAPALVERAAREGIRIQSIAPFRVARPAPNGLVLGFGMIAEPEVEPALQRLARLMR